MKHIGLVFTSLVAVCLSSHLANAVTDANSQSNISAFQYINDADQSDAKRSAETPTNASANAGSSIQKAHSTQPAPMTGRDKLHFYLISTYGPRSIVSSAALSAIKQARKSIPEWGQGMEGYGKRFGSAMGQKAAKQSIQFGFQFLLREDPRYYPSGQTAMLHRTAYATGQAFVAHKDSGGIRFAYSRFAGIIGGVCISRQWYPEDERSARHYVSASATSIAIDALRNVFHEFWPDIKRRLRH